MLISKDLVAKKLDFLNEQIHKIENMDFTAGEFVENVDIHDLIVFRLQQAIETSIDIATHIIASSNAPRKETAKDAFVFLGEKGIINKELSLKMGKAADFRNRVVHGYNDFDFKLLFKDYKEDLKDLRQFGAEILKYLDKN
ncbi:hypothetical protein A3I48_03105 [Candidatus Daviesbacteria bacterium RIFCSPLOWO2_02_FULL_36_7]|uniref:DUF86 domain-containing protein n=1 Tax=Candidatus Daviesbacteria bacterium RIFCSPLOWO2_02_FULL_36_7 TaxID=1797792 RepID=A0A1F5MG74_9BACT|nr:MAG: hypothetical protein A3I48_03105 [Candidatus Daviesbacteria bacterium RIFCSPLOWO2_02_FULL_36_7]